MSATASGSSTASTASAGSRRRCWSGWPKQGRRSRSMTSEYSLGLWRALERTLSKGRLTYYLDLVEQKTGQKDEKQKAFELHGWNTLLSESLYMPLQGFEITLRNVMDECIPAHYANPARNPE